MSRSRGQSEADFKIQVVLIMQKVQYRTDTFELRNAINETMGIIPHEGFSSSEKTNNKFKLNTLIAFALRVIGKGYTAGNKLFGMLDLPFLSKTAFRNQELKIQQAASIFSIESMKHAATEVKKLKKSPLESISCCGVSMDVTWQKRGYSSHTGCVSCISIDTGKILDIQIMSHSCRICSKKTKVPDAASNAHVSCNHMDSASSMGTVGAYRIFERS
ncbi:uncharacterized protein TNCV_667991 [Trichonephila clavipes]|nr:uncharacterized protein TNCV_667991 [Trichonephila clavipes]